MNRKEARDAGVGVYDARKMCGVPGHGIKRYVNNDRCVECERIRLRKYREDNRERLKEYNDGYREAHPEMMKKSTKKYRDANKKREVARVAKWKKDNRRAKNEQHTTIDTNK